MRSRPSSCMYLCRRLSVISRETAAVQCGKHQQSWQMPEHAEIRKKNFFPMLLVLIHRLSLKVWLPNVEIIYRTAKLQICIQRPHVKITKHELGNQTQAMVHLSNFFLVSNLPNFL